MSPPRNCRRNQGLEKEQGPGTRESQAWSHLSWQEWHQEGLPRALEGRRTLSPGSSPPSPSSTHTWHIASPALALTLPPLGVDVGDQPPAHILPLKASRSGFLEGLGSHRGHMAPPCVRTWNHRRQSREADCEAQVLASGTQKIGTCMQMCILLIFRFY